MPRPGSVVGQRLSETGTFRTSQASAAMSVVEGESGRGQGCYATAANDPSSDIAVACMIEMLAPADATRSLSCRVIEYPSQWRFGARSAYSLWWTIDSC